MVSCECDICKQTWCSWASSSGIAFCFVQVLPRAALEELLTCFLVHRHSDMEKSPSPASCMRKPCQGWAQASVLVLSVSHLGGTAQALLQVKWLPLRYKASYGCKVSTGNLHHYRRTCADGQRLSTRKAEGKSSGEPQIIMDGSKPVRWGKSGSNEKEQKAAQGKKLEEAERK